MLARVQSYLLQGIDAHPCEIEVDFDPTDQDPKHITLGLPDAAVKESHERVRCAMANSGYFLGRGHLLINLAPAHLRKEGPIYDLPIAIGLLMARGVIRPESLPDGLDPERMIVAGELSLDGRIRPVRGVIAMASMARTRGVSTVIVPRANAQEAAVVDGVETIGVSSLVEVVGLLTGQIDPQPAEHVDVSTLINESRAMVDFADVRGQEAVKRAIVVAAAGGHNLIMLGPAGTGKTMMARALPGVLPPLSPNEAIEITRIYSAAGQLSEGQGLVTVRPVRTPHHTASAPAIVGGGTVPRPGEISLAHHGVLFLDELPEFPRPVLETLRQPLEDHVVTIARAHGAMSFPAAFMLVAAMNPTPKGDAPDSEASQREMERYLSRISGPLVDRVDIHVEAPAVPWKALSSGPRGTSSEAMRQRVLAARRVQTERQGHPNARLTGRELDEIAPMDDAGLTLLGQAIRELKLSARAYDKIRRVSRTIADLAGVESITAEHVGEAVQYRLLDRG